VRKADGLLRLCIDCHGLMNEVKRKYAYPLPRVNDTFTELNDGNFCTYLELVLAFGFWQVRVREEDVHKTTFRHLTAGRLLCRSECATLVLRCNE
jgi:hypothetical protein